MTSIRLTVAILPTTEIKEAIEEVFRLVRLLGIAIAFEFNGIELEAGPAMYPQQLLYQYDREMLQRAEDAERRIAYRAMVERERMNPVSSQTEQEFFVCETCGFEGDSAEITLHSCEL